MRRHTLRQGVSSALLLAGLLGGCVAGPNYSGPPIAAPRAATGAPFARASVAPVAGSPAPGSAWLGALRDPQLDRLVTMALVGNVDLKVADARLRRSRALLRERRADQAPSGSAAASYAHTRPSFAAFGDLPQGFEVRDLDLFEASLDASWELDLAGRRRRTTEAAVADLEADRSRAEDARVQVAAETAQAYVALRAAQRRLELGERSLTLARELLELTRQRNRLGAASTLDVERAAAQERATMAGLATARADLDVERDRLAVLTGREPGQLDTELARAAPLPDLPAAVAIGDPAAMLRRRPDIRVAERGIAAASARIGVATADLFPRVTLSGSIGFQTNGLANLGTEARTYSIGPSLSWNLLDFGRVRARIEQARADRDESAARYEAAVLAALQDAEDALVRYGRAREELAARQDASVSAAKAAALAQARYREGAGSLMEALDAERDRVAADRALADAQAGAVAGFVTLGKALGLAWDRRPEAA